VETAGRADWSGGISAALAWVVFVHGGGGDGHWPVPCQSHRQLKNPRVDFARPLVSRGILPPCGSCASQTCGRSNSRLSATSGSRAQHQFSGGGLSGLAQRWPPTTASCAVCQKRWQVDPIGREAAASDGSPESPVRVCDRLPVRPSEPGPPTGLRCRLSTQPAWLVLFLLHLQAPGVRFWAPGVSRNGTTSSCNGPFAPRCRLPFRAAQGRTTTHHHRRVPIPVRPKAPPWATPGAPRRLSLQQGEVTGTRPSPRSLHRRAVG